MYVRIGSCQYHVLVIRLEPQTPPFDVHFGNVVCDGTEDFLSDCQFTEADSGQNADVYIVCLPWLRYLFR